MGQWPATSAFSCKHVRNFHMYCILYVYRCTSDMSMYSASERPSKAIPRPPHPYTVSDFQVATKGKGQNMADLFP